MIDGAILQKLLPLQLSQGEIAYARQKIARLKEHWTEKQESETTSLKLQVSNIQQRLARLTDAFIDRLIEKDIFEERKTALLMERKDLEEKAATLRETSKNVPDRAGGIPRTRRKRIRQL